MSVSANFSDFDDAEWRMRPQTQRHCSHISLENKTVYSPLIISLINSLTLSNVTHVEQVFWTPLYGTHRERKVDNSRNLSSDKICPKSRQL